MEREKRIIVAGEGHLSFQIYRRLSEKGLSPVRVVFDEKEGTEKQRGNETVYEQHQKLFDAAGVAGADVILIAHDTDELNLQSFLIASARSPAAKVYLSLFNENLARHITAGNPAVTIFNPAEVAAKDFADATEQTTPQAAAVETIFSLVAEASKGPAYSFIRLFVLAFAAIIAAATTFFHFKENLSWLDALYFTSTTITTTGFGDVSVLHSAGVSKIVIILLMFAGISLISITFSLIVDALLNRRTEHALGRKQYRLRGHIIISGLGRVGYQIATELLRRGHEVLVMETDTDNHFAEAVRGSGGQVFFADAAFSRNLRRANITQAKAFLSVIQNDMKNLEIGLTARALNPRLSIVLRIFDKDVAQELQRTLPVATALSTSAIASEKLIEKL